MNILVTGANGFLGQHLTLYLAAKQQQVWATGRNECRIPARYPFQYVSADLTSRDAVTELVSHIQPQCIIHTAAMSKPDDCLLNPDTCLQHNVEATHYLLEAAAALQHPLHFIYVSTDFIFGEGGPHAEEATPGPLNFYGRSKWMAEQMVEQSGMTYTIARTAFVYGALWEGMRPGFIQWVQRNLANGQSIKVVGDQYRTPSFVTDVCAGLEAIAQQRKTGLFHLAGSEVVTPFQMAVATAEALGLETGLIEEVSAHTFKEPVQRAKTSGLSIEKAKRELGYHPVHYKEGIVRSFNYS